MMEEGPLKTKIEANELGLIREEYTTYRVVDSYLEKTTVTRNHKVIDGDYHDTTSTERLIKVDDEKLENKGYTLWNYANYTIETK